ncbi:hypothetical protein quinque_010650 [Culex quinquefasciatus]
MSHDAFEYPLARGAINHLDRGDDSDANRFGLKWISVDGLIESNRLKFQLDGLQQLRRQQQTPDATASGLNRGETSRSSPESIRRGNPRMRSSPPDSSAEPSAEKQSEIVSPYPVT